MKINIIAKHMEKAKTPRKQISAEDKERYAQNRKVKDEQRRNQRKSGDANDRRISFLENIIKMKGLTWRQVSGLTGISPQMLSWYITKDDCYITVLRTILNGIGINMKLSLSSSKKHKPAKKYQYMVVGNIMNYDTENGSMVDKYPPYIKECINSNGEMKFLADYIVENGYRVKDICTKINVTESTIRYYFQQNDIKVSKIYEMADALEEKVVWELNEKK